jgi:hypothetical protein
MGRTPVRDVCQVDLRRDPRAAVGRLANDAAFHRLPDGTLASAKPCRVRLAHDDGAKLDRVFAWVAVEGEASAAEGLLCRLDEMPVRQAYEEAISLLISLNFDDASVDLLEHWYTSARRSPASAPSLELVKESHAPPLTLAIAKSADGEGQWRIVLEVRL